MWWALVLESWLYWWLRGAIEGIRPRGTPRIWWLRGQHPEMEWSNLPGVQGAGLGGERMEIDVFEVVFICHGTSAENHTLKKEKKTIRLIDDLTILPLYNSTIRRFDDRSIRPSDDSTILPLRHLTIPRFDDSSCVSLNDSTILPLYRSTTRRFDNLTTLSLYHSTIRLFYLRTIWLLLIIRRFYHCTIQWFDNSTIVTFDCSRIRRFYHYTSRILDDSPILLLYQLTI